MTKVPQPCAQCPTPKECGVSRTCYMPAKVKDLPAEASPAAGQK